MKHATAVNIWDLSGFSVEILEDRACPLGKIHRVIETKCKLYFTKIV